MKELITPRNTKPSFMKNSNRAALLASVLLFVTSCSYHQSQHSHLSEASDEREISSLSENATSDSSFLSSSFFSSSSEQNESSISSFDSSSDFDSSYSEQIESKMAILAGLKTQSEEYDVFTFYTDHHCFSSNGTFEVNITLLESHFELIKYVQDLSESEFVLCGGDLLNNNDTKMQACYKLSLYMEMMDRFFENPFIIVGNHDTNYQGNTYIGSGDYESCALSQETINDILFNGGNSYYSFDTQNTSFYCFDSGIDWSALSIDDYQQEQLEWFADSLLGDTKAHKAIFIHIPMISWDGVNGIVTAMMSEIDRIVTAFNEKGTVVVNNNSYDYSSSSGVVEFLQSGHWHRDINDFVCGGVPAIVTASFCPSETVTRPTFDVVFADYTNHGLHLLRIGDGEDRYFEI